MDMGIGTLALQMMRHRLNLMQAIQRFSPFMFLAAILMLFASVQIARLMWAVLTPVAPYGDWQISTPQTIPAAERAALFQTFDPFFRMQNVVAGNETITSLPITLFGIRSNEASGSGSAIIADAAGLQNSFATGEEIMPGVTLHAVAFDHVVISNNGALEKLYLDQSVPAATVGGPAPSSAVTSGSAAPVTTAGSGAKLSPETIAKNVGLTARNENGKVTGLVVSAKDDGSTLKTAGLRDGDIIVSVNGSAVGSAADLVKNLRPGANVSLEVERGAQKLPLAIFMEKQ
jgi:general secretion pathway protein C